MSEEVEGKRKGAHWRPVKVSRLSKEMQKVYKDYQAALEKAKGLATDLKEGLKEEWNESFPNGREQDGKVCTFNVMGGVLQYTWVDRPKKKSTEADEGDDVFAHP
jgi:hypothetical protein